MADHAHSKLKVFAETRDEACFGEIVGEFGGLVYSGAFRRTGDPQLAEEITQNVFVALAVKADQVAQHPSLSGWLFTTTKLEAARRLRDHHRHTRKLAIYASNHNDERTMATTDEEETWREALPELYASLDHLGRKDRELVLARYLSGHSYREMAAQSGSTEAACKMRVRRALDKLQRWLGQRGVALSVTAIATGLTAEFANAAPSKLLASLPAKALASAQTATSGNLITQSIIAMNLTKPTAVVVAVFAAASVPFAAQHSESKTLQTKITTLQMEHARAAVPSQLLPNSRPTAKSEFPPIKRFFAAIGTPPSAEELQRELSVAMQSHNMVEMTRVLLPLGQLSSDELNTLMDGVAASHESDHTKSMALSMLADLDTGEKRYQRMFERAFASGSEQPQRLAGLLGEWASSDFPAALDWFQTHRQDPAVQGKGLEATPESHMLSQLSMAAVSHDPDIAVELARDIGSGLRQYTYSNLIHKLVTSGEEGRSHSLTLIEAADESERYSLAQAALSQLRGKAMEAFAAKLPPSATTPPKVDETDSQEQVRKANEQLKKAQAAAAAGELPSPIQP